jgi:hypothetical protein
MSLPADFDWFYAVTGIRRRNWNPQPQKAPQ